MKNLVKRIIQFVAIWTVRVLFVVVAVPVLYIVEPFRPIRIGIISTQQIGVMAGNIYVFLQRHGEELRNPRRKYIFPVWNPANRALLEIGKRYLPIVESRWLARLVSYAWPIALKTRFVFRLPWSDKDYEEFFAPETVLEFTEQEESVGREELRKMGIKDSDWFVCIHVRDQAYKASWVPQDQEVWSARSFRNSSIENYLDAAKFITGLGGYVIRMGHTVAKPLSAIDRDDINSDPKIIDYATTCRSDFMDIYLSAKCRFFLGNNSGLFVVSTIFQRPVALANFFPIGMMAFHTYDYLIPKMIFDPKSKAVVPYWQLYDEGFYTFYDMFKNTQHEKYGYEWLETDSQDILELAQDMIARLEGRQSDSGEEGERLANYYKDTYYGRLPNYHMGGAVNPSFALRRADLIVKP